mgnify:CR=1 FL=1
MGLLARQAHVLTERHEAHGDHRDAHGHAAEEQRLARLVHRGKESSRLRDDAVEEEEREGRAVDEGPDPDDRRDVVHAVLCLGAVVLLHARVAVDREGDAAPTHHRREPREVEVVWDTHACVSVPSR